MKEEGAVIIDVRSEMEYSMGKLSKSKNIPLQIIGNKEDYIKGLKKPIIFCCATGSRSGRATNYFKQKGVSAINGGGWKSLLFTEKL